MMEREPRIVVFGVGGAGTKVVGQLSNLPCTEIIAVDRDRQGLVSLEGEATKILLSDESGSAAGGVLVRKKEDIRTLLIEKDIVFIVQGIGRKTGIEISTEIAEQARMRGIPCIAVSTFPFSAKKTQSRMANATLKKLAELCSSVIIVDNTSKTLKKDLPMLSVFHMTNQRIAKLIATFVESICDMTSLGLGINQLASFFEDNMIFVLEVSRASGLKEAIEKAWVSLPLSISEVKKLLIMAHTPVELEIPELRGLASEMQERKNIEDISWINKVTPQDMEHSVTLLAGVRELPNIITAEEGDTEQDEEQAEYEDETKDLMSKEVPQALINIDYRPPEPKENVNELDHLEETNSEEEIASELSGFPLFKRKGQKKLNEYTDLDDIDYI